MNIFDPIFLMIVIWIVVIILSVMILYDGFKVRKVIKEILADVKKENKLGLTFYDEPGEVFLADEMKIIQANPGDCENGALVALISNDGSSRQHVLYRNSDGIDFYDDQIISIRSDLEFRQIGQFVYRSINHSILTVPVVDLFERDEE
jgi:hypothetical protein